MILVTGAAGVMGRSLMVSLCKKGYECRALVLEGDPAAEGIRESASEIVYGDITKPETLNGICQDVDTVFHLAGVIISYNTDEFDRINVRGTENLLKQALSNGVEHFIYISSASVVYPKTTAYSRSKKRCERIIRDSGINYTIIRPTLVYDFGKGSIEFDYFLKYLKRFPVIPFIGKGDALKRPVRVDAVKRGLASICGNRNTYGKIYNFSGTRSLTIREFAAFCMVLMKMEKKRIIYIPVAICRVISFLMGIFMSKPPLRWQVIAGIIQDADLNPEEAIQETGFTGSDIFRDLPECFPRKE